MGSSELPRGAEGRRSHIFVVVPVYNEDKVLKETLVSLVEAGYSVVAVDDASTDASWEVLKELEVFRLQHPINLGQGAALQTGMDFAFRRGAEFVVHYDADGQHRLEDIEALCRPLEEGVADIVLGSRFLRDSDRAQVPLVKRVLLRGAIVVNKVATGMWLSDAHNGLRALNRTALEAIDLTENGFAHASEILWQIKEGKLRYKEEPCHIQYTEYSKAKGQSVWNAINIAINLLLRKLTI